MQVGVEPKSKDIEIKKFTDFYEIHLSGRQIILWVNKEEMTMLRNRITEALKEDIEVDRNTDMFKGTDTFIDKVGNAGGFDRDCMGLPDIKNLEDAGDY